MVYHVIVNPAGASGRAGRVWKRMEPLFRESGKEYEVHYSAPDHGIADICRDLERAHLREEHDSASEKLILITVGGDGSVNEAMNGIDDPGNILYGHIPAGSGNDIIRDMNLPKKPEQITRRILEGKVYRQFDVGELLYVDDAAPDAPDHPDETESSGTGGAETSWAAHIGTGKARRFAISCGIGFDAGICEMAGRSRFKNVLNKIGLGKLIYIVSAFRIVSGQESRAVDLTFYDIPDEYSDSLEGEAGEAGVSATAGERPKTQTLNRMNTIYTAPEKDGHNRMRQTGVPGEFSDSPAEGKDLNAQSGERRTVHYDHLLLLACMNHQYEGGGFRFAPDAAYDDSVLNLCIADPPHNSAFYKIFPFALFGAHYRFACIHPHTAHSIEVRTEIPMWVHTDGEVERKASHIRIRTLEHKLDVLE